MGIVTQNLKRAQGYYLISITQHAEHIRPKPGQFYMLRCSPCSDPLLRRPLSIHGYLSANEKNPSRLDFLYRVVGVGTRLLSQMKPGDHIELFGPLGKGFELTHSLEYALFIAGGIGIAPLPYLAECLAEKQKSLRLRLLIGAKTAEHILATERFEKPGFEISVYTENGSKGMRGCVTENLDQALDPCLNKKSMVFACGPAGMLAKVAKQCISLQIPCQVSIDRRMACGVGACQGCVIRAADGTQSTPDKTYKRVCIDGPVFHAHEILWPEAEGEEQCPH